MADNIQMGLPLKFDIHPSVVPQLGADLVTDDVQALVELIKNCYDADADYAKITINTIGPNADDESDYPKAIGSIIVEDNGTGMDIETIKTCWMFISNRAKRKFKQHRQTTKRGRTPLGDKGLGRLSTQRLGRNLEVFTQTETNDNRLHISFCWDDFLTAVKLSDIDANLKELQPNKSKGTKLVISNLNDIGVWQGSSVKQLEKELSRMISPYKEVRDFTAHVEIDGKHLELLEISDKLRSAAQVRYLLDFDGSYFKVSGKAKFDFFRPNTENELPEFGALIESDNGKAFLEFLLNLKPAERFKLKRSKDDSWYIDFESTRKFDDIDNLVLSGDKPANPGRFSGQIDGYDLGFVSARQQSVFDRSADYKNVVKDISGVRVYRDGFGIRVAKDWLGLGADWTSATSYYGLKPENTLGYIALSARDNMDLEETTDREGFKLSPYYDNFYQLLGLFKSFTLDAHQFLRRGWVDYRKKNNEKLAGIDKPEEPEDLSERIKTGLSKASSHKKALIESKSAPKMSQPVATDRKDVHQGVIEYLDELSQMETIGQVLVDQIQGLKYQITEMYATVALGLTSEALSHEIYQIADQLAQRASKLKAHLRRKSIKDPPIISFTEHVNTSVNALRKQIAHLSPSLKYVREKKERLQMSAFLKDVIKEYYYDKLARKKIQINVAPSQQDFSIKMNKGKMTQVFDNLILNSEYWLNEDIRRKRLENGIIDIEINKPFVRISDNGRGIEKSIESSVFEPFVTDKGREKGQQKGRGLGLFIVRQLLDSEGCHIAILPKRNKHGRLYIFQIDLRSALDGTS